VKYHNEYFNNEKKKEQEWKREHKAGGFKCSHCRLWVVINNYMGTINRNHCNICLWSKHVDGNKGDRNVDCHGGMKPIGLTFKHEGLGKQGEIMLVHECAQCRVISINRIAGDDDNERILSIFDNSISNHELCSMLKKQGIIILAMGDRAEINIQLLGRDSNKS
jgi:RNHCP domain-containing protein